MERVLVVLSAAFLNLDMAGQEKKHTKVFEISYEQL